MDACSPPVTIDSESYAIAGAIVIGFLVLTDLVLRAAASPGSRAKRIGVMGLLVGVDGRTSTSKLMPAAWTIALTFGLLVLILNTDFDLDHELQPEYLLLLGGPFAAAITAKVMTASKVSSGDVVKEPAESGISNRLADVVADDEGNPDLGDSQYFIFNLVALIYFFVALTKAPCSGLPDMPGTLVGLTSASALVYVSKKGLYKDRVVEIYSAIPGRIVLGRTAEITISGFGFLGGSEPTELNNVILDGVQLESLEWTATGVKATLDPDAAEMGLMENQQAELVVTDDRGRKSEPYKIWVKAMDGAE